MYPDDSVSEWSVEKALAFDRVDAFWDNSPGINSSNEFSASADNLLDVAVAVHVLVL